MHLAATAQNGVAHILYDARQLVCTYMRMGISQDIRRSTMLAEDIENLLDIAAFLRTRV